MKKKIPQQTKDKIVNEYFKGKKVSYLCKKYKIQKSAIYNWIKESKDELSTNSRETKEHNIIHIVTLVLKGDSVKSVCKKYKLKQSTVYYWVNKFQDQVLEKRTIIRKQREENIDRMKLSIQILKQTSIVNNMSITEKVELIVSLKEIYPLKLLCELFDVGRSTYYKYVKKEYPSHIIRDQKLMVIIKDIFIRNNSTIGTTKIKHALELQGYKVSYKKIREIMKTLQLTTKVPPKKNTFIKPPRKTNKHCTNLLKQEFTQKQPNLVWVSDITEIKINRKPVYLCVVMDLFSRKVISHTISRKNNTRLTLNTLKKAMSIRKTSPNMFHSDRGVNYTAYKFQRLLKKHNVRQSFSAPGYPFDNAVIESFFSQYKREAIKTMLPFKTIQDYIKMVKKYITYYNNVRFHMGIAMLTPSLKERIYYKLSPIHI
jgi:transposase InsO family protein/transposase-like protein